MDQRAQIIEAATQVLREQSAGLTGEALARLVAKKIGQNRPQQQIVALLRTRPQVFIEDGGGRWQLRQQETMLLSEETPHTSTTPGNTSTLKRGCYVVFDLEATRQDALSPYNEIIQIAAERWIDGQRQDTWMSFVQPSADVPERIIELTKIKREELHNAPSIQQALKAFFEYVGDLPLIAHNGASYDGPLITATCQRLSITLPDTFQVLDTLPLARMLLPTAEAHRVGTLAAYFNCAREDAHRADADVDMLAQVIKHLEARLQTEISARAAYELLRKASDSWANLLTPPTQAVSPDEVIATFGANITPLLPETASNPQATFDQQAIEGAFALAEAQGRSRREAQFQMSQLTATIFRDGGYAVIEAGTGTGKSQGYLIPTALSAHASGQPIAISTFTRVLQNQLVQSELPFIQKLVPEITYAQLQGRNNYLSLTRLAEEVEDALAEDSLPRPRAWMLATLLRFATLSVHGNFEELGVIPQSLDSFLQAEGAVIQVLASVRASAEDEQSYTRVPADFYRRARENADRANLVIINHALLLKNSLGVEEEETPFAGTVVCDEAHTLEDAATKALERRVEERVLRRILRAIYSSQRGGLVSDCLRRLKMASDDPVLQTLAQAVDKTQAALDNLADRLHYYVKSQTVISKADLERYGVRVRIERSAEQMAGGPALKSARVATHEAMQELRVALSALIDQVGGSTNDDTTTTNSQDGRRRRRIVRLARSLQRDLHTHVDNFQWFWSFGQASNYVSIIELERQDTSNPDATSNSRQANRASVAMSAVPINVGPLLWQQLWSRLDAALCTSATLTVYGQGFDFFLRRIGLEHERIAQTGSTKQLVTHELPHAFDYHSKALLMLPNDLPAPRDSELKRNFPTAVADLFRRFIPTFDGRTLGLFTANSRRDFVYEQIVDGLAEQGFPMFCQGQGSLQRLVEDFRNDEHSSLLGTRSLWEGVDVPGPSLSYVFLEKLPYPSLGDPIEAARMGAVENAGGNSFYDYLLPKMVIILKQGFGRLIRTNTDKGAVVLLDKRLRSSLYRHEVLGSLPDPSVSYESDVDMFRRIAEWMGIPFDPDALPAPTVPDVARILREQELKATIVAAEDFEAQAKPRLLAIQKAIWNQDSFRDGQEEIIRDVLAGKDVLTLLPTGAGKSRTYQLPALIRAGLTLVISPLIALIRDQVEKLREVPGVDCVASLVSGMDAASQEDVLHKAAEGKVKLLYISPERLRDPRFQAYLPQLKLLQLVIDEAHCISTWGHDFRPDFLDIVNHLPQSGETRSYPIHALTATATRQVQDEITDRTAMGSNGHELVVHTGDFTRANLIFRAYYIDRREERDLLTLSIVHQLVHNSERGGAGIVYVATRKSASQLARLLRDHNVAAQAYHGGLETAERHQIQERFMQGDLDVVVATSAFGMGVDKAEIRFVLHYDHPNSLEAYAQEAGRAGRDGKDAYAILLYHRQTQQTERFIARQGKPDRQMLRKYRDALLSFNEEESPVVRLQEGSVLCNPDMLAELASIGLTQARVLLYSFEDEGLIERDADCTLEATILFNQPIETILQHLTTPEEQQLAQTLFSALGAEPERQVTYRAGEIYQQAGIDPRQVDPLLVTLARSEMLIYRAYSRGITLKINPNIQNDALLKAIENKFARRYLRFEERLERMLEFARLRAGRDLNKCRSAELINYLTGRDDAPACGKCDLCSPTQEQLPWDPGQRMFGGRLEVDVRLAILGAVRDHNNFFGRGTIERMLLGIPFVQNEGQRKPLPKSARTSEHFEELQSRNITLDYMHHTFDALIEGGYLQYVERTLRGQDEERKSYQAISITQKGRDALAGGIELPKTNTPGLEVTA